MSLLLARSAVTLYPAAQGSDGHGWAEPGSSPVWAGTGNLQAAAGRTDTTAAAGGGLGPFDPRSVAAATLYLPPDAPLADGMVAEVAGRRYALSQARQILDPLGPGDLDCWAVTASGLDDWPA